MYVSPTIRQELARAKYDDMLREARQARLASLVERPSFAERIRRASADVATVLRRPQRRVERPAINAAV